MSWMIVTTVFLIAGAEPLPTAADSSTPAEQQLPAPSWPSTSGETATASPAPEKAKTPAQGKAAEKKVPKPYKDPFYNNDFSYLDDPAYVSEDPFDLLKRIPLGCRTKLDIGGEYRLRLHDEGNVRLEGTWNDFLLQRTRLYGDLHQDDWFRAYVEFVDARNFFGELPPRASEVNPFDGINLFGDLRLWKDDGGELWARGGRQELDYGSQRLIASADWANTRLTFDGAKIFWKGPAWNVDAFWTRPVPLAQHLNNDDDFDHPDLTEQFMGLFATCHAVKDQTIDLYFLRLERDRPVKTGDPPLVRFAANTPGARWLGRQGAWLWEVEGAYQFGYYASAKQAAGFWVAGVGHEWQNRPCKPVFWLYYDWASGNDDPGGSVHGTFNQLTPQTHRYLGLTDIVGRQNLRDLNCLLTATPCDTVILGAEAHIFHLQEARDSLYGNGGAPLRTDRTGRAGTDVGQEVDFTARFQLSSHANLLFVYGHVFAGPFLANTGNGSDVNSIYTMFTYKF